MLESDVNKKYFLNKRLIECFKKKDNNFNDKFKPAKPSETPNCISTTNKSKHTNNFIKVVGKLDIKARDEYMMKVEFLLHSLHQVADIEHQK